MISWMRKFAKTWVAGVLFLLLILALAITLPDTFGGSLSGGTLSRVGDREIKAGEVRQELDRAIRNVLIQENRVVSLEEAANNGMAEREYLSLEYRNTILAFADKMGIRASAEALKPYLERSQVLTNAFGRVDMASLRAEADDRRMSARDFEGFLQDFLTQRYVEVAAFSAISVPQVLSEPFIQYFGETRTISLARPTDATLQGVALPTDADLQAWYDKNKERFAQPERRRISALVYTPDDFMDRTGFTDEQVRAHYDTRIKEYSTPETRVIVEYKSADRSVVQAFVDLAAQGIATEEALAQSPGIEVVERTVQPEQVENADYRGVLFQMEPGRIDGRALQLAEGEPYFTMMVKSVTPGTPTPFEQVMDQVRRDMSRPEASRLYEESGEPFRDAAGGQPLEDIGAQFGIPVFNLAAIDRQGRTANGDTAQLLAGNNDAMVDLFSLAPGQMTTVFEEENKRSMFRLDEIIAPYTPAFEDVKDEVRRGVMAERQIAAMENAATAMVAAVTGGADFAKAAVANKLETGPAFAVTRGASQQIDPGIVAGVFELKAGEAGIVRASNGETWVARVDAVADATPEASAMLRVQMAQQVSQSLQQDLGEVFQRGLQKEVEFQRNDEAIRAFFQGLRPRDPAQ